MLKIVDNEAVKEEGYTLDALAREGARRMLMSALEEEVAAYVERHAEARDAEGRRLLVRNGQAWARVSAAVPARWKCGPLGLTTDGSTSRGAVPIPEPDLATLSAPFAEGGGGPAGSVFARTFDGGASARRSRRCSARRPGGCRRRTSSG
jgi:hypothetical protein